MYVHGMNRTEALEWLYFGDGINEDDREDLELHLANLAVA